MRRHIVLSTVLSSTLLAACCGGYEVTPSTERDPEATALAGLASSPLNAGLTQDDLQVRSVEVDGLGQTHVRLDQLFEGLPVVAGEAVVHLDAEGSVLRTTDKLLQAVSVQTTPTVQASDAIAQVVESLGGPQVLTAEPSAELVVTRGVSRDHLAWRVLAERVDGSPDMAAPEVLIDAHDGAELRRITRLITEAGSGESAYHGPIDLTVSETDAGVYLLEDRSRGFATWSLGGTGRGAFPVADHDGVFSDSVDQESVDVHFGVAAALDFFLNEHGRDGIDGAGGPTNRTGVSTGEELFGAYANFGESMVNAFWYEKFAAFGDGDGRNSDPLTSLDVVGHELTHGVVQFTADLVYADESGALNESFADVFGNLIERSIQGDTDDTFLVGEAFWTPHVDGDALRYMSDPTADGNSRDHYDDRYTGAADYGGVHYNSGIANLAFSLAAIGGEHPTYGGQVHKGLGIDQAGEIWYRALTVYLTSEATFADARDATVQSAADLQGSDAARTVAQAWSLVGVN